MKLFRLTTNYPKYIENFHIKHPDLVNQDYRVQHETLMKDAFGWADFWTRAFSPLGYEVWEPVSNAFHQQIRWANENEVKFQNEKWLWDISIAQIDKFQPDILFINDYHTFNYTFIKELRERVKSIRYVIGWCGAPYPDETVFKAYDLLLTNLPQHLKTFLEKGLNCKLMKHAFDPKVSELSSESKTKEFSFVGSIVRGEGFHNERLQLIEFLCKKTKIQIYSDIVPESYAKFKEFYWNSKKNDMIQNLIPDSIPKSLGIKRKLERLLNFDQEKTKQFQEFFPGAIVKRTSPGLFGMDMYKKLSSSLVTLNQHIDISKGSSNNMRLYEASGVGGCLLTDWTPDLKETFEIDTEIVAYRSFPELLEKLKFLEENPRIAIEMGRKAQKRTLKENTFENRAIWIDEVIKRSI